MTAAEASSSSEGSEELASPGVRPRKLVLRRLGMEVGPAVRGGAAGRAGGGADIAGEGKGNGRGPPKLGTAGATIGLGREEE